MEKNNLKDAISEDTVIEAGKEAQGLVGEGLLEKKKLQDLNLLDDFLFNAVVSYPEIGEKFSRKLLEIIFQREFGELTVVPQKVYYGSNLGTHGARLDVYLEEDGAGVEPGGPTVLYDLEADGNGRKKYIEALPRRVRFYHSKLDAGSLKSGTDYRELKDVVVVMIMPYDPFQKNRMVYTVRNTCEEEPDMPYDDGAKTLFLYTKGEEGNPPEELKKLLKYMEETSRENAVTETLEEMQGMVEQVKQVKQDGEVLLGYMKIFEREAMLVEMAQERAQEREKENTERERKRADAAESQVEMERSRADEAESQVEMERSRANAAEKQVRLLKEELEKLKNGQNQQKKD